MPIDWWSNKDDQKQDQDQDQKQDQDQDQKQDQLQGQLQGQAQGQLQFAVQDVYQESDNKNENENENENKNENENTNENKLENEVDNKVENEVENKVENSVENKIENNVETNVEVDVKVDLDLEGWDPEDNDLIDIDLKLDDLEGIFQASTDEVDQKVDNGNAFNIDQVNTMVDNDYLSDPKVTYDAGGLDILSKEDDGGFSMWAKADGGEAKIDDTEVKMDDGSATASAVASADAIISQEAFTQNIVMGANIQFNSIDITAAGDDLDQDNIL